MAVAGQSSPNSALACDLVGGLGQAGALKGSCGGKAQSIALSKGYFRSENPDLPAPPRPRALLDSPAGRG